MLRPPINYLIASSLIRVFLFHNGWISQPSKLPEQKWRIESFGNSHHKFTCRTHNNQSCYNLTNDHNTDRPLFPVDKEINSIIILLFVYLNNFRCNNILQNSLSFPPVSRLDIHFRWKPNWMAVWKYGYKLSAVMFYHSIFCCRSTYSMNTNAKWHKQRNDRTKSYDMKYLIIISSSELLSFCGTNRPIQHNQNLLHS